MKNFLFQLVYNDVEYNELSMVFMTSKA